MLRRALRILPAFWVCLLVVAFAIAPLSAWGSGEEYRLGSAVQYVLKNWWLQIHSRGIADTLLTVPYPLAWNGSLWTLFYEFGAYVMAGTLLGISVVRRHLRSVCLPLVVVLAVSVPLASGPMHVTSTMYLMSLELGSFFVGGMTLYAFRRHIQASGPLALAALAVQWPLIAAGEVVYSSLAPLPLVYLLVWLGGTWRCRIGAVNDMSYGVYIYAFPMQQILALNGVQVLGFVPFAVLSFLFTLPQAWVSWHAVEKPSMSPRYLISAKPVEPTTIPAKA